VRSAEGADARDALLSRFPLAGGTSLPITGAPQTEFHRTPRQTMAAERGPRRLRAGADRSWSLALGDRR
jgi:hypothetical protein